MAERTYRLASSTVAGIATLIGTFSCLAAAGAAASWVLLDADPTADRVRVAMIFGAISLVLACAVAGWVSAWVAGCTTAARGFTLGLGTAIIGLIVLVALAWSALRETADFYSVGVALGWIEIPEEQFRRPDVPLAPSFATPPVTPPDIEPAHMARERTMDTVAYVAIMLLMSLGAGGFGGIAGITGHREGT